MLPLFTLPKIIRGTRKAVSSGKRTKCLQKYNVRIFPPWAKNNILFLFQEKAFIDVALLIENEMKKALLFLMAVLFLAAIGGCKKGDDEAFVPQEPVDTIPTIDCNQDFLSVVAFPLTFYVIDDSTQVSVFDDLAGPWIELIREDGDLIVSNSNGGFDIDGSDGKITIYLFGRPGFPLYHDSLIHRTYTFEYHKRWHGYYEDTLSTSYYLKHGECPYSYLTHLSVSFNDSLYYERTDTNGFFTFPEDFRFLRTY